VKNPALPEEIAALAPLVGNDFFFQIKSRYELDGSFESVHPGHLLTPHIGLVARAIQHPGIESPDDREGE